MAAKNSAPPKVDVVIVGAGFSGLYLLHRLRRLGFSTRVFEAGTDVGGTWYWNRYPGARCDVESMQYSYSFSEDLQQEWGWSEKFSAQPEILEYAGHVADRFDLRRDIEFETTVNSAHFDAAQTPEFMGLADYKGETYHTGNWPHERVDFTGKRIAVIGTGSSGIQAIPVLAEEADHVTVFQRTPNYSLPSQNEPMTEKYSRSWKDDYAELRKEQRYTPKGNLRELNDEPALSVTAEARARMFEERWAIGGPGFFGVLQRHHSRQRRQRDGGRICP